MIKLDLFDNKIENIDVLDKVPFKNIEELDLSYNSLKSVAIFNNIKFEKLKDLKLGGNSSLNYSGSDIKDILDKYNIKYNYDILL